MEGVATFGPIGDSAPDSWDDVSCSGPNGISRIVRNVLFAPLPSHYLLGVADQTRLGALRFRLVGTKVYQAPTSDGVPTLIELGRLLLGI